MTNGIRVALMMAFLGTILACMVGCAKAKPVPVVIAAVAPEPTPEPTQEPQLRDPKTYQVQPGDCLWNIAKGQGADPFLWPILWKANRDYIMDPDNIEIGEILEVPHGVPVDDIGWARGVAADWPERRRPGNPGKP